MLQFTSATLTVILCYSLPDCSSQDNDEDSDDEDSDDFDPRKPPSGLNAVDHYAMIVIHCRDVCVKDGYRKHFSFSMCVHFLKFLPFICKLSMSYVAFAILHVFFSHLHHHVTHSFIPPYPIPQAHP